MNFQVAITDRYRKTYRNCSHSEQKDIDNAIDEWRESPEAKGSNFEKLNIAGDNIFSIRISRGGRIIMAKFESTYFLLHVDPNQHDKANNWARNKKIDWNIVTGAIQIFNTNVEEFTERIEKKTDNSSQPRIFENYTEEELKTLGVPNDWISAVIKIRNEDDLLDMSDALPEDAWNNLSILLDGTAEKEILIAQLKAEISEKPSTLEEQLRIQPDIYISSDFEELTKILRQDISNLCFW
jgi:mRNA-degrading endonuclease RelE of RelBE toxin-antitoxin system